MAEKPKYHATKKYKLWVKEQLATRKWTYEHFAAEVTRRGFKCSEQALHKLLGNKDEEPIPSNTTLMPGINKALGLPVPSHFDPTNPRSVIHAAIDANWDRVPEATQRLIALNITGADPG